MRPHRKTLNIIWGFLVNVSIKIFCINKESQTSQTHINRVLFLPCAITVKEGGFAYKLETQDDETAPI